MKTLSRLLLLSALSLAFVPQVARGQPEAPSPVEAPAPVAEPAPEAPAVPPEAPAPAAPAAAPAPAAPASAPAPAAGAQPEQPTLQPPELLDFINAEYPAEALAAGLEAAVRLGLQVLPTGAVGEVKVLEPAGSGFDEAAVLAAKQFRFKPALYGGQPVGVAIRFTYRFTITEEQRRLLNAPEAQPDAPTLKGRLLRRGRRDPLPGLGVRVDGGRFEAESDEQGRFELRVPPGKWSVEVVHPDFEDFVTEEEFSSGEALEVTYYIEPASRNAYRSVVRARRAKKTVTRTTLEQVELVRVPGTFGEPFRVVQSLPGVARSPFGLGFVIVRGAAPQDTGFYIDDFEIPILYHFLSGPAVFQSELIESLDFYPGNFPVRYGRKLAGIITGTIKEDDRVDRVRGLASVDLLDVEALVRVPIGEHSEVSAAARRSHFDLLIPLVTDETIRPRYWDYQLLGRTRFGDDWRAKLVVFGSSDTFDLEQEPDDRDDPGAANDAFIGIQFHRVQGRVWRPVFDGGRLDLAAKLGWAEVSTGFNEFRVIFGAVEAGTRANLNVPLIKDHLEIDVGADVEWANMELQLNVPSLDSVTAFPTPPDGLDRESELTNYRFEIPGWQNALYTNLTATWGPVKLIPGLRLEWTHFGAYDELTIDPRLVMRWEVLQRLAWLKGGVGIFHQPPDGQAMDERFGSPDTIHSPWAVHYSLGGELQPLDFFDVDLTLFYNSYEDLVLPGDSTAAGGQVQGQATYTNDGQGRSYGAELLVRHRPNGPFFGWIAYTLSRSQRRRAGEDWGPFAFDQTHIFTAVASLELGKSWTLGLKFQLVTGNPRTPVLGGVYDGDTDRWDPVLGPPLSDRNPAFHQLDLRVDKLFTFDTWRLTAYLDLLNVYNRANTEFVRYNYDFSESQVIPGIPILPSLGVKGEF